MTEMGRERSTSVVKAQAKVEGWARSRRTVKAEMCVKMPQPRSG